MPEDSQMSTQTIALGDSIYNKKPYEIAIFVNELESFYYTWRMAVQNMDAVQMSKLKFKMNQKLSELEQALIPPSIEAK